jgi:hypothetical protein
MGHGDAPGDGVIRARLSAAFAVAAAISCCVSPSIASPDLVGTVLSREGNQPIPFATIRVLGTELHTETSTTGTFLLRSLPPGVVRVGVALVGYRPFIDSLLVSESDTLVHREYRLEPIAFAMRELVIQPQPGGSQSQARVITTEEMGRLPATADDLFRAVQLSPGIAAPDVAASFLVRGGESDETLVRLDDIDLLEPFHIRDWGGAISVVNLGTVENARLKRGGLPAQYGRHLSGALEIETPQERPTRVTTTLGANFTQARAVVSGPVSETGSYLVGARHGLVAALYRAYQFDPETQVEPDFQDVTARLRLGSGTRNEFSILGIATRDHLKYNQTFDEGDIDGNQRDLTVGARWKARMSDRLQTTMVVSGDVFDRDRLLGHSGQDVNLTRALRGRMDAVWTLRPDHAVQAGFAAEWEDARVDFQSINGVVRNGMYVEDLATLVEGTAVRRRGEGYISLASRFGERVSSTLGVNLATDDYDWGLRRDGEVPPSESGSTFLSPRASGAWRICSWLTSRLALGILRQPMFLNNLDATRAEGTLGRRREAREAVAGLEVQRSGYQIRVDGYTRRDRGVGVPVQDLADMPPVSLDEGSAWGVEVLAHTPIWPRFDAWFGYARSSAVWATTYGDVARSFDQPNAATASMNVRCLGSLNLNATARYHTGNAYTETEWVSLGGNAYFWNKRYGPFMGARYPDYFRLDFRATHPLPIGLPGSVAFLDLVNATGRKNVYYYWWTFDELPSGGAEPRRTYTELFPRLPYLGFEVTF